MGLPELLCGVDGRLDGQARVGGAAEAEGVVRVLHGTHAGLQFPGNRRVSIRGVKGRCELTCATASAL